MPEAEAPTAHAAAMVAHTDRGRVRESNEDSYVLQQEAGVAVIADGMGGHAAGEVASGMATESVAGELVASREEIAAQDPDGYENAAQRIGQIISSANGLILERSAAEIDKRGMGTTVDAVLVLDQSVYVAHVGDSRVYWVREGMATPVTRDHSLAAALVDSGRLTAEEAAPLEGVLVRALGIAADLPVDVIRLETRPGDALLLCTDGLWRYFPDPIEIAQAIDKHGTGAARKLIDEAIARGGEDNVTAVVILLKARPAAGSGKPAEGAAPEEPKAEAEAAAAAKADAEAKEAAHAPTDPPLTAPGAPAPADGATQPPAAASAAKDAAKGAAKGAAKDAPKGGES